MKEEVESRPKEYSKEAKVTTSILDAFDLLKAPNDDTKIIGSAKIVSILQASENTKDKQYAIKRLVRSLGANVPDMRIGYFAALVKILSNFDAISVTQLLELIKKELHASGSSKSEIGDVSLGQILVCGAIFRSGLILRSSLEEQIETVKTIFTASKKKSYLSILAFIFILDFSNTLDDEQFVNIVWSQVKDDMKKELNEHSLDSLYFILMLNKKFPSKVKLKKLLGVNEILCEDTVHTISEKLMGSIDFSTVNHPIYNEIGETIANSPHLKLFWTSGIDSQLTKHNRNRELVALNLLTTILTNIKENYDVIPELFSKNFFKLFMDWFKGLQTASKVRNWRDDEDDQKIMIKKEKELLHVLAKTLKSDDINSKLKVEMLKKLLFHPGEMNFTEITGTNLVKSIIADLDKCGIKKMAKLFKGVLLNTSKKVVKEDMERTWYNNERLKAAEGLSYLVCHEAVKDDIEFKLNYMKLLMCFGFFKIGGDGDISVSSELAEAIKSSFYRCFSSRFSNVNNMLEVLSALCSFINTNMENEKIKGRMVKQFSSDNIKCWEMLMKICETINGKENKCKVEKVFLILLWQLGLYLFSEPKSIEMAKSSIEELKSCYQHYKKDPQGKLKKPHKVGDLAEDEPEWIEVLVEILLSILSTESSVLRSVVQCVFRLLWEYLTPSAVGQIVSVLDPENENNPLTINDEDSDDSDESDEDNDEEEKNSNIEEQKDESGESDVEIEEDEGEDMKTPEQLRLAVHKALGSAAVDSDMESIDADMIDEEEGKKLDDALSEAFRMFHASKNQKTKQENKDKKTLSDFRIRVLDLIDIYLEKDPPMDICLSMMTPLIRCLEFSLRDDQYRDLENRSRKTIKLLTKIRKFSSTEDVDIDILCDYLKSIIEKGSRSHFLFRAIADVITHCASFIVHCALKIVPQNKGIKKKSSIASLISIYKESLESFFRNRNCLLPIIFFHSVLQIDWDGNYELVPVLIENAFNNSVRHFRRNEALELLIGFYRSLKKIKSESDIIKSKISSIEILCEKTIMNTLNGQNGNFTAKNNFFIILKKLINTIKSYHESCHAESSVNFDELLKAISTNKNSITKPKKVDVPKASTEASQTNNKKKKKKNKRKADQINGDSPFQNKKLRRQSTS